MNKTKNCLICGVTFEYKRKDKIYCSPKCCKQSPKYKLYINNYMKEYRQSPEGKSVISKYKQSPQYKLSQKKYRKKYEQLPEVKLAKKKYMDKYNQSPAGKLARKKHEQLPKRKLYQKEYKETQEYKLSQKEYKETQNGKAAIERYNNSPKGKLSRRKIKARRRGYGFIPWNEHKKGYDGHHIDDVNVIYIPEKLHENCNCGQNIKKHQRLTYNELKRQGYNEEIELIDSIIKVKQTTL